MDRLKKRTREGLQPRPSLYSPVERNVEPKRQKTPVRRVADYDSDFDDDPPPPPPPPPGAKAPVLSPCRSEVSSPTLKGLGSPVLPPFTPKNPKTLVPEGEGILFFLE
jgi:hypothetical protein